MKKNFLALIIFSTLACVLVKTEAAWSQFNPNYIYIYVDQTHEEILSYWTLEKMGSATGPFQTSQTGNQSTSLPVAMSTYHVHPEIYRDPIVFPYNTIGMVFFTMNGKDHRCTGSALGSSGVVTAAACISNGREEHAKNWIFIPGMRYWEREDVLEFPYGIWTARRFMIFKEWHEEMNYTRTIAGAHTRINHEGRRLSSVIGGSLDYFIYNSMDRLHFDVIGYEISRGNPPRVRTRQTSSGWAFQDTSLGAPMPNCIHNVQDSHFVAPNIPGSPWIVELAHGKDTNTVNRFVGVTGYAHRHPHSHMTWQCSPKFDNEVGSFLLELSLF